MNPVLLAGIFDVGKGLIDKLFPDPSANARAQLDLLAMQQNGVLKELGAALDRDLAQAEINKVEASSPSIFVSGWRPGIGWVCVAGLAYQYLLRPLLPWMCEAYGHHVPPMPDLDGNMMELVFVLLGFGGLRTYEKQKGLVK